MLILYQFLSFILIPFIKINILIRILKGKEDKLRYRERYGITSIKRPKGQIIWIHTASVGEFKSATILINNFYNQFNILLTTTTVSAANYAIKYYGNKIIHQYAPLDIKRWVNIFLKKWKPQMSIWIESDLWPTTLDLIKKQSIKSIILNLRVSPKSYKKWLYFDNFYKNMINTFDEIFAQSPLDKKRIEKLIHRKINYIGNLKLSLLEQNKQEVLLNDINRYLNKYKIIMLASTHTNEEKLFLSLIKRILKKTENLKIIIAPRHPERAKLILNILKNDNIDSNIINQSSTLNESVLIVDTLGQMPFYFSISDIVFLGGSLVEMGGHNPVEPAHNNCVIITGPHIYNWEDVFNEMKNLGACFIYNNIDEIEKFIENTINDKTKLDLIKNNAKKFSEKDFFQTESLFKIINNIIRNP